MGFKGNALNILCSLSGGQSPPLISFVSNISQNGGRTMSAPLNTHKGLRPLTLQAFKKA